MNLVLAYSLDLPYYQNPSNPADSTALAFSNQGFGTILAFSHASTEPDRTRHLHQIPWDHELGDIASLPGSGG